MKIKLNINLDAKNETINANAKINGKRISDDEVIAMFTEAIYKIVDKEDKKEQENE